MDEEVRVRTEETVRWIAINRPQTRNGLTIPIVERLLSLFTEAATDAAVRCVVLGGEGAFCSGLDLKQGPVAGPEEGERVMRDKFNGLILAIDRCPKPTVAFVDGAAAGFGVSLALACDLRVATDRAHFAVSFARIGLCPDGGATWLLPRVVGPGKALEMMLLCERIDAATALRVGLCERVLPQASATGEIVAYARRLAAGPPLVQRLVKEMARRALVTDLPTALEAEVRAQMQALRTRDFGEGLMAFLQKRDPRFTGE